MVRKPIVYHLYPVEYLFKIIRDSYGISFISHPPLSVIGGTYRMVYVGIPPIQTNIKPNQNLEKKNISNKKNLFESSAALLIMCHA